jgi:mannan endo-1,4-beta-mannosidase
MLTRRTMLGGSAAMASALLLSAAIAAPSPAPFVRRRGTGFTLGGAPYRFVGANIWYGAYLGATAEYGNRDRLKRELDALLETGVTNLRVLASAEEGPLRNSVKPGFRGRGDTWNPALLDGLDYCLAEMGRRNMKAVLYVTNFWEWSGGMATYLYYVTGKYIDVGDPAHPWPAFPNATAQFYANKQAVALYRGWVRALVSRTNAITGVPYAQDPTIMSWQLANEPRPGGTPEAAAPLLPAFYSWTQGTAKLIKSIDSNHLVSTGSEGLKGTVERADIYLEEHGFPEIDYCTAHIWPLNWSWIDARDLAGTSERGLALVREYIDQHIGLARKLGKPLVIEEFGYPRDGGGYDPEAATNYRNACYKLIFDAVENSVRTGGPIQGSNFWAWNGEGRAAHGDHRYKHGDPFLGDPPHEPQGWYGMFDSDASTKAVIKAHAAALASMGQPIAA